MDHVLLVDKPAGITSHDVVARVRRTLPRKTRVGHSGTLDPFATGLLVVLVGRATRVQRFVMALEKEYLAEARFGWTSSTGDPEGELLETGRMPAEPLVLPTGVLRQRPPAHSAVKVDGERAYAKARRGEVVELDEREVVVHEFERVGERAFRIRCGAGTYVRTLIADLGDAYCTALRRTRIGPFSVGETTAEEPLALPLGAALARFLPFVSLDPEDAARAGHGVAVAAPRAGGPESGPRAPVVVLADADGPIALAEPREGAVLKPVVGFRG